MIGHPLKSEMGSTVSLEIASRGVSSGGFDQRPKLRLQLPQSYRSGESARDPKGTTFSGSYGRKHQRFQPGTPYFRAFPALTASRMGNAGFTGGLKKHPFRVRPYRG